MLVMLALTDAEIDNLIEEDVPYLDLTTAALGISAKRGTIQFSPRADSVICGTEEASRILAHCGCAVTHIIESGAHVQKGQVCLSATGTAAALHAGWKISQNLLEYATGIASRTRDLVHAAQSVNPGITIVTTRKVFPGTKKIAIKGILAGGAFPHRLGLSETILIFKQHYAFLGGMQALVRRIPDVITQSRGKKVAVAIDTLEDAVLVASSKADIIQCDKMTVSGITAVATAVKQINSAVLVAAAGGINAENIRNYAGTGADMIVTTWPYFGKPADIQVIFTPDTA